MDVSECEHTMLFFSVWPVKMQRPPREVLGDGRRVSLVFKPCRSVAFKVLMQFIYHQFTGAYCYSRR